MKCQKIENPIINNDNEAVLAAKMQISNMVKQIEKQSLSGAHKRSLQKQVRLKYENPDSPQFVPSLCGPHRCHLFDFLDANALQSLVITSPLMRAMIHQYIASEINNIFTEPCKNLRVDKLNLLIRWCERGAYPHRLINSLRSLRVNVIQYHEVIAPLIQSLTEGVVTGITSDSEHLKNTCTLVSRNNQKILIISGNLNNQQWIDINRVIGNLMRDHGSVSVILSESVTTLPNDTLVGIELQCLVLPKTLSHISLGAFVCSKTDAMVVLGNSYRIFYNHISQFSGLKHFICPGSIKIGDQPHDNDRDKSFPLVARQPLESITLPPYFKAFKRGRPDYDTINNTLKYIALPEGLGCIGIGTFYNYKGLKSIYIPKTVKYIGSNAFGQCENLRSVSINLKEGEAPEGIKIEENAFEGCNKLISIAIKGRLNPHNLEQIIFSCPESIELLDVSECEIMETDMEKIKTMLDRVLEENQDSLSIVGCQQFPKSSSGGSKQSQKSLSVHAHLSVVNRCDKNNEDPVSSRECKP